MSSVAERNNTVAEHELFPGVPYSPEIAAIAVLLQSPEGVERIKLALDDPALIRDPENVAYVDELKRVVAAYDAGQRLEAHARYRVQSALERYGVAR